MVLIDRTSELLPENEEVAILALSPPVVSAWTFNDTWAGTILNLGCSFYVAAARAVLRTQRGRRGCPGADYLVGVVVEAFGYRDLRAAHRTTVRRLGPKKAEGINAGAAAVRPPPSSDVLDPVAFRYLTCTLSYKLCVLWFRAEDFLPGFSYSIQYNGRRDYEERIFLRNISSHGEVFGGAPEVPFAQLRESLPPSELRVSPNEWGIELPSSVVAAGEKGTWGNSEGPPITMMYSPLGL